MIARFGFCLIALGVGLMASRTGLAAAADRADKVLADFDGETYGDWQATGTAFGTGPLRADALKAQNVHGFTGKGAVHSAPAGEADKAVGTLTSPEFVIDRAYLNLLVCGGSHDGQTCVNLLVDGKVVQSVAGVDRPDLLWHSWDLAPWQGKTARVQIVDQQRGGWGHIDVDEITLSDRPKIRFYPNPQMNQAMAALAHDAARIGEDSWWPRYHFHPQSGWMNDVNGPFYYKGFYHIFYQHHPYSPGFGKTIGWGHARSKDLVHWTQFPFAVWPSQDRGETACWSGGMAFDAAGSPVLLYASVLGWPQNKPFEQWGAVPADKEMITWKKHPNNPLVPHGQKGEPKFDRSWRDPFGFVMAGRTMLVVGGTRAGMPIYEADDPKLGKWRFRGIVFAEDAECPNFFQLGDHWVFLSSAYQEGVKYSVGTLDLEKLKYEPKTRGVMDEFRNFTGVYGTGILFDNEGRCIFLARAQGGRNGWNGYMILPRVLTVGSDGYLRQAPIAEIEQLREAHESIQDAAVQPDKPLVAKTKGSGLEIQAGFEPQENAACGLQLRRSDDGRRAVTIRYADGQLDVAGTRFPLKLEKGQPLKLRVFLDQICLEVFVGDGRHVVTKSVTPPDNDLGVAAFAEKGAAKLTALDVWKMRPAPIQRRDDPPGKAALHPTQQ
ncbi:MAG: glycoside hydrolase family 32 protein [Planctomycetia bacterium]|nr:glycoside hydrolase family 32 protein [Planctomycetia bacterium]